MKTNKLIAAALLPLLFSCAKENIAPADNNAAEGNYVTINLAPDSDAVTRATFDDSKGIIWQPGVKAGLIKAETNWKPVESESLAQDKIYDYEDPKNDNKKSWQASFEFKLVESDYSGSYKFFYPYHSEAAYTGDYIKIPFWVDPKQYSGVGQSSEVFAVVSKDKVILDPTRHDTPALTYYKVVGSYIRFLVYGKAGKKVKSISIQSEQKPSGKYFVNGNTNELNGEAYTDDSNTIKVAVTGDYTTPATKSAASGIYASVLPERPLKNTYTVETDKGWYKFESQNEANFAFGSIKDVLLNLENTKCKYAPAKLFIIGGATTAGWHADNAIELTKVEGKYQFELKGIKLNAGEGDSGFKFLTEKGSWDNVYVNGMNDNKTITYYEKEPDKAEDIKFSVPVSGYYDVLVDFDTNQVTCKYCDNINMPQVYTYPEGPKGSEVKANMSFTETENVYKAVIYLPAGNGKHDFKINYNNQFYHVDRDGYQEVNFSTGENKHTVGYDWAVVADNKDKGWWVYDEYCNKYYEVTLDLTNNKVSLKLAQGKNFWLIGAPFGGWPDPNNPTKNDTYKGIVDSNGVVTWEVTTEQTGDFKICGENTLENNFWGGEWYYSTGSNGFDWSWDGGNNYSTSFNVLIFNAGADNNKWKLNETGKFKIVFDTKNLTIQVYKNSLVSRQMAL